MFYTVYKTTNKINNKIYIGAHKTNDLDDGYLGSGKILGYAIEKYGIENFEKEILAVFDKSSDMFDMESELVNEDFVENKETYNLKLGGHGGFDHLNDGSPEHCARCVLANKARKEKIAAGESSFGKNYEKSCNNRFGVSNPMKLESVKNKSKESKKLYYMNHDGWSKGSHISEDHKRKIGLANSTKTGNKNSQYGTMWICNLASKENKKIKNTDPIPAGWIKGRKINF